MDRRRDSDLTRRSLLAAAGTIASGSAGCIDYDGRESGRRTLSYPFRYTPRDVQLNPWAPNYPISVVPLFNAYRTVRIVGQGQRLGHLIETIDIDGTTATVQYNDGYTWWNGDQVTARDDYVRVQLEEFAGAPHRFRHSEHSLTRFVSDVELVDKYTLRYDFRVSLNPSLVRRIVGGGVVSTPARLFDRWVEQFRDATTTEERETGFQDFFEWQVPFQSVVDNGFGSGPFMPERITEAEVVCERFDPHPHADQIQFNQIRMPVSQRQRGRKFLANSKADIWSGPFDRVAEARSEDIELLDTYPLVDGYKVRLNWRGVFTDRRVRWAILAGLPIDDIATNAGWGVPVERQTGMGTIADDRWLSKSAKNRLQSHPTPADPDRVENLLENAGYERHNGHWQNPDGTRMWLRLIGPNDDAWVVAAKTIVDSLESAGVSVRYSPSEKETFKQQVRQGQFDLALWWHAGSPFTAYDVSSARPSRLAYGALSRDQNRSREGKPVNPELPRDNSDLRDSDRDQINLIDQWNGLRGAPDEKALKEQIEPFARWWNYDIPDIQIADAVIGIWKNTSGFTLSPRDDHALRTVGPANRPDIYALKTGAIHPK